ncbi:MAG: hypothetical protein V3G42_09345 [Oscillospiraceae bacterium]
MAFHIFSSETICRQIYRNLCYRGNVRRYTAFAGCGKNRLNATDITLLITLAYRCSYIVKPKGKCVQGNIFMSNGDMEEKLAETLCVKPRTLRDSFLKLRERYIIQKISGRNGKYMVNPFIAAKGNGTYVRIFHEMIRNSNTDYLGGHAEGDIYPEN